MSKKVEEMSKFERNMRKYNKYRKAYALGAINKKELLEVRGDIRESFGLPKKPEK